MPVVRLKNPKSIDLICLFPFLNKHAMAIVSATHEEVFPLHSPRLQCAHHDIGVLGPFIGSEAAPDLPLPHPWPKRSLCDRSHRFHAGAEDEREEFPAALHRAFRQSLLCIFRV
jgi:hypothetical protein